MFTVKNNLNCDEKSYNPVCNYSINFSQGSRNSLLFISGYMLSLIFNFSPLFPLFYFFGFVPSD